MVLGQLRTPSSVRPNRVQYTEHQIFTVALFPFLFAVLCTSEWKPALDLAAIDCAAEENRKVCTTYSIRGYPTLKVTHELFGQAHILCQIISNNIYRHERWCSIHANKHILLLKLNYIWANISFLQESNTNCGSKRHNCSIFLLEIMLWSVSCSSTTQCIRIVVCPIRFCATHLHLLTTYVHRLAWTHRFSTS